MDIPESGEEKAFFGSLESVRGVAALLVAVYHVSWLNLTFDVGLVRNSYLMVDVFFVLSGFVMCHGYGNKIRRDVDLRDFFVLRLGRLYPLHILLVGIFLAREVAKYGAQRWFDISTQVQAFANNTGNALVSNLLLIHSLGLHNRLTYNAPSWSISVEFYAYVIYGLVVLGTRNWPKRVQLIVLATISFLSLVVLLLARRSDLNVMYDFGWFRCCMGFFLGATSYLAFAKSDRLRGRSSWRPAPFIAFAVLIGAAVFLELKGRGSTDFFVPPLAALLVVALAASPPRSPINRWLQIRPLTYLGKVSYSIYMVHFALASAFVTVLVSRLHVPISADQQVILTSQTAGFVALLLYVAIVLLVSHFTFTYIEEPFRIRTKPWVAQARRARAEKVRGGDLLPVPSLKMEGG